MFGKQRNTPEAKEYTRSEGLFLADAYLDDPSSLPCPHCGPGTMEVVCFLDSSSIELGDAVPSDPEGDYLAVLYCHGCGRAGAVDLSGAESGLF